MNWLFARNHGGTFLLRIDDTDVKRCRPLYAEAIQEDLKWLGLDWDALFYQSHRIEIYQKAVEILKAQQRIYPCYESQEELETKRQAQLRKGQPPIYDRASLYAPKPHDKPHWRFFLQSKVMEWEDEIQGTLSYHVQHLSDPIVVREDGSLSYLLTSVVDDIEYEISHIFRGADHITNTAIQIQLFELLSAGCPQFAHFPLIVSGQGEKFSKRTGSFSLKEWRTSGILPLALCQTLSSLGSKMPLTGSLKEMARAFSLKSYSPSRAQWDMALLEQRQHALISQMTHQEMRAHCPNIEVPEALWQLIRMNIATLAEIQEWVEICTNPKAVLPGPLAWAEQALSSLPLEPWDERSWPSWMEALGPLLNHKKGAISFELRKILTGKTRGPQMRDFFPLMRPACVRERLEKASALFSARPAAL